jgi:hypothetical protein
MRSIRQVVLGFIAAVTVVAVAASVIRFAGLTTSNGSAATRSSAQPEVGLPISGTAATAVSALQDKDLGAAPSAVIESFRAMHPGAYADAKDLGHGMYLASNNGALCAWVVDGIGECKDRFDYGDLWLNGSVARTFDSPSAPFQVDLYGFARDNISAVRVTANGTAYSFRTSHNAFRGTIPNATFSSIESVEKIDRSGKTITLDTSAQLRDPPGLQ